MLRKFAVVLTAAMVLAGAMTAAEEKKDEKKAPAKEEKKAKKGDKAKGTPATVVSVDAEARTAKVKTDDGKTLDLKFGKEVKFVGPEGGKRKISDSQFAAGKRVRLVMDGSEVKEVHLSYRS